MKKNNMFTNLKDKVKNTKYNFSKNFFYHLIAPCVAIVVGLVLLFCVNFNLGLDFKGGTLATVVCEQDLSESKNYNEVKKTINEIFKDNKVEIKLYQKVETSYYGNGITVKFDRVSDEVKEQLKYDLINEFYPTLTDENDLATFVKVDNFDKNVHADILLSTTLAVLVSLVAVFVYIFLRHGICAAFTSVIVTVLNLLTLAGLLLITRVRVEMGVVAGFAFVTIFSLIYSMIFASRMSENLKKEKYAKTPNQELANITVKDVLVKNCILTCVLLITTLLLGVVPTQMVRSSSLPLMIGAFICFYSSLFIIPGLWSLTYIRNSKKSKQKNDKQEVVIEEKLTEDDINNAPEVIVETEAK